MGIISWVDEKWGDSNSEKLDEGDEEEALSLCDLPVSRLSLMNEENQTRKQFHQGLEAQDDFDFGSWPGGSVLAESEMCAADDVFFKGQILPLRHSVSSDSGFAGTHGGNPSRCFSRSESMDHGSSSGGSTSVSSRSSSTRSQNSSTSTASSTTTAAAAAAVKTYKPRIRNQFHAHPSPKPQIRIPNSRLKNVSNRSPRSTVWDIFRLGLVRTPEIELQDLKIRGCNGSSKSLESRHSSCSSTSSCSTAKIRSSKTSENQKMQRLFNRNGGTFLSGCKCSAAEIENPSKTVTIKNSTTTTGTHARNSSETLVREAKKQQMKQQPQVQGKQSMSRHRTFEWLKELAHAGAPEELH